MLVLTRKPGEKIHIGSDIIITVLEVKANKIRIGIAAPDDVTVLRAELTGEFGMGWGKSAKASGALPRESAG